MLINCCIKDGADSGLSFDFIPCNHAFAGKYNYQRDGADVFSVREEAFLFVEGAITRTLPKWKNDYSHWGVSWLSKEVWLDILSQFPQFRRGLEGSAGLEAIVRDYVIFPQFLPENYDSRPETLISFVDNLEQRVRAVLERYPYLIVSGI